MALLTYLPAAVLAVAVAVAWSVGLLGPNTSPDPFAHHNAAVTAPVQAGGGAGAG